MFSNPRLQQHALQNWMRKQQLRNEYCKDVKRWSPLYLLSTLSCTYKKDCRRECFCVEADLTCSNYLIVAFSKIHADEITLNTSTKLNNYLVLYSLSVIHVGAPKTNLTFRVVFRSAIS